VDSLTIIVVVFYLAVTAFLGWLGYRRTKNAKDYLLAGRQVHPAIMAVSYGATFISTSAIVGFGGAASKYGMGILWLTVLNIMVGIFIAFVIFGKRTRRIGHALDAHTFPELLGKRYDSTFLQVGSGLVIFIGMPLYAGAVLLGGATYLVQALSVSKELAILILVLIVTAYVMFGGMKGVMYTDAFQGVLMFVGMAILLVFTYSILGGVTSAHERLASLPARLTDPKSTAIVAGMAKDGFTGWMSMPKFGSPVWMQLVSTIVLGVGIGVLAQPQLVVRFMTVKSDRELNRGVIIGGVFILMMTGVAFVTGALSNVLFFDEKGMIALALTMTDAAPKGNPDAVIPNFIKLALPWFNSIFMVTLLAAAMSTMSSQVHTMGSAIGRDVLEKGAGLKPKGTFVIKIGMGIAIILSALLAWYLPLFFGKDGSAVIATGTSLFFGLCAATFLPLFAFGIFWKGATKAGAVSGFIVGLALSLFWLLFVYAKVSGGFLLCKAIFGVPTLAGTSFWKDLDPLVVATPLAALTTWLVSLATPKLAAEKIRTVFGK
jgi:solute:Na+ symporter, SSS family